MNAGVTRRALVAAAAVIALGPVSPGAAETSAPLSSNQHFRAIKIDVGPLARIGTLIWDARFSLVTALLAGFGRAAAEVGAVIIVGGNIDGFTRVMTTAIALETSKGDLPLAIGLGLVLITVIIIVNAAAWGIRRTGERLAG